MKVPKFFQPLGNLLAVSGYFTMLNFDPITGVTMKLCGFMLVLPGLAKNRMYSLLCTLGLFFTIDITYLVKLIWAEF